MTTKDVRNASESPTENIRSFKELLARRVWALPKLTETEKELLFKQCLLDLDRLETALLESLNEKERDGRAAAEENEILRNLLGITDDELRGKVLTLEKELDHEKQRVADLGEEAEEIKRREGDLATENKILREKNEDIIARLDRLRTGQTEERQEDIRYFSEKNESLKNQLKDLDFQLGNLRELYAEANESILREKQEEIAALQKKLLDDMQAALREKQELLWAEESMFAKGVAARVRQALVSAQGDLFLTLERLGLLDPETKAEAGPMARLKLLAQGGDELRRNFHAIQERFADVVQTLDHYLELTGVREGQTTAVDLRAVAERELESVRERGLSSTTLRVIADDAVPFVAGDEERYRFVVRALVENAVEALADGGGDIRITVENKSEQGFVRLVVADTGGGIPDYLRPRLFQPFFTTKTGRRGLSLSRARRLVEAAGGRLDLAASDSSGTTFEAQLPVAGAASGDA